jgi:glycine betaine/proline transport system permease protein
MPVKVLLKEGLKKEQDWHYLPFWITADLGDGLWDESIQTTTLVIVSTLIALIFGVPLGIFARSKTDVIIRPILDLMQTMPAFVYLTSYFLFSVGNTPGVVATVIFSPTGSTFN